MYMLIWIALRHIKGLVSEGLGANHSPNDFIWEGKGQKTLLFNATCLMFMYLNLPYVYVLKPAMYLRFKTCHIFTFWNR